MSEIKENTEEEFTRKVGLMEDRIIKAQKSKKRSVWAGLGLFGMVGWSVVVPTLGGAALGMWLDKISDQSFSWTLTFLIAGLVLGCLLAWHWVEKEHKEMHDFDKDG